MKIPNACWSQGLAHWTSRVMPGICLPPPSSVTPWHTDWHWKGTQNQFVEGTNERIDFFAVPLSGTDQWLSM